MNIYNNREGFYQWDLNQRLTDESFSLGETYDVCNKYSGVYTVATYEYEGSIVIDVPNILLQRSGTITVYKRVETEDSCYTYDKYEFTVQYRPKPTGYVYTQTEVLSYESLDERITELENTQISQETIANAVNEYMTANPIKETDPTVPSWAKAETKPTYTADEVGAITETKLQTAIDTALAQAKASGEFDGADGQPGADGKSAYQYAQDGGYTGSQEEFAAKLAADYIPVPATAEVGQTIVVKAVDESGKPTEWAAADMPSVNDWRLVKTITVEEDIGNLGAFTTDNDGNEFSLSAVKVVSDNIALGESSTATSGNIRVWLSKRSTGNEYGTRDILPSNVFIEPAFTASHIGLYVELQKHGCVATVKQNVASGTLTFFERTCYNDANIERIAFTTNNAATTLIGAGTILYVWGIDA